ncbi:MAG: hypothetical protein K8U57_05700 [Planctomycetes bacterium]|nr:hypothetical protein [Planctomycetota bacterium]
MSLPTSQSGTQLADPPVFIMFTAMSVCGKCGKSAVLGNTPDSLLVKCETCGHTDLYKGHTSESVVKAAMKQLVEWVR